MIRVSQDDLRVEVMQLIGHEHGGLEVSVSRFVRKRAGMAAARVNISVEQRYVSSFPLRRRQQRRGPRMQHQPQKPAPWHRSR